MHDLSKPQKSIYNMEKFIGGTVANICCSMLRIGKTDSDTLKNVINELYCLNDVLRVRIIETENGTRQSISDYRKQDLEILNFSKNDEFLKYAKNYAKQPIDLYGTLCDIKIIFVENKYGLLVKLHHIIGDAWTMSLLAKQFAAVLDGETPQAYSYIDYLEAEKTYVESKRYQRDKQFFLEQFHKCDEITYLSDKQDKDYNADRKTFTLTKELTAQITALAESNHSGIFAVMMTLFGIYFSRIKMNAERFYVGTPVLNRTGIKEQNTMGMFINTVPFLTEIDSEKTFVENLQITTDHIMSLLRHQHYNYEDLLSELRKEGNLPSQKLYDVVLSFQNAKTEAKEFQTVWHACGMQTESLQIHIDDRDGTGRMTINYDYRKDKFTEKEIERIHGHLFNLFADAIKSDGKKICELEILSSDEKNKLLHEFNDTKADYPKDKCVHQLFEEQVLKTPDKTAVIACDKTLTYDELNKLANRVANALIEMGIGNGDIVAFALPRRSYLIAVMLGILKSGAAYLPIDPDYPQGRIEYMLEDSRAKLYIAKGNVHEYISQNEQPPNVEVTSDDYCYCIFTSGSTGKAKGVLITHHNVVNFCTYNDKSCFQHQLIDSCKSIFSVNSIAFDITLQEILLPLLNGLEIILASDDEIYTMNNCTSMLNQKSKIGLIITPTKLELYCQNNDFQKSLSRFSLIMMGAEVLKQKTVETIQKFTRAVIINGYGPTETTCGVTYALIKNGDITIGKPMANTQIYIVDTFNNSLPIGHIGELCIAGEGVGAGYLNHPELTDKRFINNPFGKGTLYKTGDLAYWREDGNVVFVGRNDFQVKIRGFRIELGEIENAICSTDGILQAIVVVRCDESDRQFICAFYTEKSMVDVADIKENILHRLPKYMLPHIFKRLDEMPLTESGKIDRKGLPNVNLHDFSNDTEYIEPETETEKLLVSELEQILSVNKISVSNNFFDVGGDSLKAIELLSKLEIKGFSTTIKDIFDSKSIKTLSKKLKATKNRKEVNAYDSDIPATFAQIRVFTEQNRNLNSTAYNIPYVFKVNSLDVSMLQVAINKMIKRHEILRTHFENKNGRILQIIDENVVCKVECLENNDILSFIRPFDLAKAPLVRVGYYENILMLDVHHIIMDGHSMHIFLNELNDLYMGRELNSQPIQYRQFSLEKQDFSKSKKYWLSIYNDELPELEINTDLSRGQMQSFNGDAIYDTIDIKLHEKIIEKCRKLNITPFVFYMSAYDILLAKFSGDEDIIVGIPISGRENEYLNTMGMFVNTIAIRNRPSGSKRVAEFFEEVKENSLNAITNQKYPFGELVRELKIVAQNRNPLFDVMFSYQSKEMTDIIFGDRQAELLTIPIITSKYDFTFSVIPCENNVVLMAEYCTDLYTKKTINRFIDAYKRILIAILDETRFICDISIISKAEEYKIFYKFNNTKVEYPKDKCVHQLFEERVMQTPNKTAVIACDRVLSYDELNNVSNRIANALIEKGVGNGNIVAFALPRRSYLIAVMLGILKSGAAYLPIDPDYPRDRIEYMLSDSQAKLYITKDVLYELLENKNAENPKVIIKQNDIFCALHTSGSTGTPKLSLLTHQGIVNFIYANKWFYDGVDVTISTTIVTFDAFIQDTIISINSGVPVVLGSEEQIFNQNEFEKMVSNYNNALFFSTPTKLMSYVKNSHSINMLDHMRRIIVGGEAFTQDLLAVLKKDNCNLDIYNGYGPAETTCGVTYALITNSDINIGKPIANVQIYIVDKYMRLTPIGVTGELCVAGDGVGAGYLNRPELTVEKFIDNPFGEGKLYKTGDLAYWREDGNIMFVGRNDFQVKIRGLRIELGEIESAIGSVDGISQAVAVVRRDKNGRQLICAFYTEKSAVDVADIKRAILDRLPQYMLPHVFKRLDEMPLTPSGKINRNALPDVDLENISSNMEYVKPQTKLQKEITRLMEQVLNDSPIGLNDDFFDCGGDSLKAIEFVSKAHAEGIYFNMQAVYDNPTAQKLCEYIENGDKVTSVYVDEDFCDIHKILSNNVSSSTYSICENEIGNLFLTGATGYLGIHILAEFLENEKGKVYCLVRGNDTEDGKDRLKKLLDFYFDGEYVSMLDTRIIVINGDLLIDGFGIDRVQYDSIANDVQMVIHAAASVKHYGSYKYFYDINVESTKRVIQFTGQANAKLIHVSTLSVSGNSLGDNFDTYRSADEKLFGEDCLFIGQELDNVYIRSKFEAEKVVVEAMADGLRANICRMGNLTNRYSDCKFQYNYESNAFAQRVKALLELSAFPDYLLPLYAEFTPVDDAARAVMMIAKHFNTNYNVFHVNNHKVVYFDKLLKYFENIGIEMEVVDDKDFARRLRNMAKQSGREYIFETFVNDMTEEEHLNYDSNIRILNDFTVDYLRALGFEWSDIRMDYVKKYVNYFKKIGYIFPNK